ncbi:uncharacterized protein KIAA0930 homolog isoform X1 [Selaginella moellendorffii]|uniref:uncharacterized protein KIAA0930 homolog isoform X1 n=1 Tax=Selaginella moellendorffii TaxID=88036 RepID=UPI000D1C358E|nr:uncharacterized protein KIAA0930 homolog isoform X1 [Selaginella moellendorffii]|eukprot:XP_002970834.2 uncharacterized protein KIAA0930 homolog isoform X1 [Selaginella moellendorffii]
MSMTAPSRDELLAIVRKYSSSLGQTIARDGEESGDSHFWQEMLDMFFVRGLVQSKTTSDDLLFFVNLLSLEFGGGGFNDEGKIFAEPCFVRRWQPQLSKVLGDRTREVDWRRSFYLNLVVHTTYTLTVSICSREELLRYRNSSGSSLESIYKITKNVFASPSRSNFQTKSSKASETVSSYPDIYFSVDDHDDTFEHLILKNEDHCYCVLLHATGGAAFGSGRLIRGKDGSRSSAVVTLFSGFVSYEMVRSAFESGKLSFGFLHLGGKSERLVMRGPGGRGEVDVIVTRVPDPSEEPVEAPSPIPSEKTGAKLGIGTIVRKAADAAKHAYLAASSGPNEDLIPLRCSLLSVSLDWETLAHDLLFKGL